MDGVAFTRKFKSVTEGTRDLEGTEVGFVGLGL